MLSTIFASTEIACTQQGLLTSAQLIAMGCPKSTMSDRVAEGGPWQRLLPRVILLQTGAPSSQQRLQAALLHAGRGACLTGDAALALYEVRAAPRLEQVREVDVLVSQDRSPRSVGFVRIHRTHRPWRTLPVQRLPCAPLVRAALQAVPYRRTEDEVVALLAELVQNRRVGVEELLGEVRDAALGKVPGVAAARDGLVAGVRSVAEAEARRILRTAGIPDPLWNRDLRLPDGAWVGRADAYWPGRVWRWRSTRAAGT